ncbi:KEOPS complex subunit Pcc1 [Halorubrum sp. LN27]|uniref:KEOPS complex subunit Pcc1 n=1 Tax=Halorubrum sp. LN27 TaxID=2801032 RepID=UPI00190C7EA8|nr:KEOPS complex subunit Pcc1 [Halorubrum sp. LN27]
MTATRAHETVLTFSYPSERRARLVGDALEPEVGEIDDARSAATVARDGDAVRVRVVADDLVALRAGINSWSRLVEVAERVGAAGGRQ